MFVIIQNTNSRTYTYCYKILNGTLLYKIAIIIFLTIKYTILQKSIHVFLKIRTVRSTVDICLLSFEIHGENADLIRSLK